MVERIYGKKVKRRVDKKERCARERVKEMSVESNKISFFPFYMSRLNETVNSRFMGDSK